MAYKQSKLVSRIVLDYKQCFILLKCNVSTCNVGYVVFIKDIMFYE